MLPHDPHSVRSAGAHHTWNVTPGRTPYRGSSSWTISIHHADELAVVGSVVAEDCVPKAHKTKKSKIMYVMAKYGKGTAIASIPVDYALDELEND